MTVAQVLSRPHVGRRYLLGALAILAVCGVAIAVAAVDPAPPPREIRLVARDMAFYAAGDPTPNPTLTLQRGERVRLVLRNQDPGMTHDFASASLGVASQLLRDAGDATAVTFTAPRQAGEHDYSCTPHATMMRGRVVVR